MQNQSKYESFGTLFFLNTKKGSPALIGLSYEDYSELFSRGFKDEEVYITVKKTGYGSEYTQHIPELKLRAGLCTIQVEGALKFQLSLNVKAGEELLARGFKDGDKVSLVIELSPYRIPSEPVKFDELNLGL